MIDLNSPIETLQGVGEKVLEKLHKLKIKKVRDLLFHLPFRYEDFSNIKNVFDLQVGEKATITARVLNAGTKRTWETASGYYRSSIGRQNRPGAGHLV